MGKGDAELRIGCDASEVQKAASVSIDAWRGASGSIAGSLGNIARSLGDVVLSAGRVNFAAQHEQVKQFESATAHLAIATGGNLETMRSSFEAVGTAIGKRPAEVAAWTKEVGTLTYNFSGATEAMKGMAGLAAETGRNVEDYKSLAVELGTVGKVSGDTSHAIGVLKSQADALGVKGGVAQFADQVEGLGGVISHFAVKADKDFFKVTALAGELAKNLGDNPAAAARVQQGAFGAIAGDPMRWSRYLHRDILDPKTGEVADPTGVMKDVTAKIMAEHGKGKEALRILRLNFTPETGTAMYNADYKHAAELAGLGASASPQDKLDKYRHTDAGQRDIAGAHLAESSRHLMGSSTALGRAADALEHFAASSPIASIASTFAATAAGGAVSGLGGKVLKGAATSIGGMFLRQAGGKALSAAGNIAIEGLGYAGAAGGGGLGAAGSAVLGGAIAAAPLVAGVGVGLYAMELRDQRRVLEEKSRNTAAQSALELNVQRIHRTSTAIHASGLGGEALGEVINAASAVEVRGQKVSEPSLVAELLKRQNTPEDAQRLAHAVAEALKQVKFTMINATGGPADVVNEAGQSAAAGGQQGK